MPPIVSEIVKFTVKPGFALGSPEFAQLRTAAVECGVKEQYYGMCTDAPNTLLWVIQWPADKGPLEAPEFRKSVKALDAAGEPVSSYLPFAHESLPRPALTAPMCQLCFLHVGPSVDKATLAHSLDKTFTDCYFADGFAGGNWATASNDDRLNYYYLGYESRAHHTAYSKSDLCAVEMNNLVPHMDSFGTYFMKMTQQLN
ncbi:hypothetical protein B0H17DRAFT_1100822 [Mycena rosella]|uniref:Uncharacterized protein n=1 Tax=Mycena rosella TaxID=1033263 RepID=A0AAD7G3R0_MYCRO|nr:hypothetical protein B0H17DRAFT_1100822 [Mycena rosella]